MARLVRNKKLGSRTARYGLKARKAYYWSQIEPGFSLGYYRGKTGGNWVARRRKPDGSYQTKALGVADDMIDADGIAVLSFAHAIDAGRKWWKECLRAELHGDEAFDPAYTVTQALDDYLETLKLNGARDLYGPKKVIEAHLKPGLGSIAVVKLTTGRLSEFQSSLAALPRRKRIKKDAERPAEAPPIDPQAIRARKATANRIMTVLRAALNLAFRQGKVSSDHAWRRLKAFQNVDSVRIQWLTPAEAKRLVEACPEGFGKLVMAGLLTGGRYGEIRSLEVRDIDLDSRTVHFRYTKNGRPRHAFLTDEGRSTFARLISDKSPSDRVFPRDDGNVWGNSQQIRRMKAACKAAGINPAVTFHGLRHTYGALLAQSGVPMHVIATALGHRDTRITEKHYAHLCPNYVANSIRDALPVFGFKPKLKAA